MESKLKNKQAELESEKEHQKKSSSGDLDLYLRSSCLVVRPSQLHIASENYSTHFSYDFQQKQ